ncbi:MAG: hypothetical protein DRI95_02430 [Bacteroidetes bacterium]|nr:MAG: hypothetical protein DRI95_02430 [Bacteroidota bacterium]
MKTKPTYQELEKKIKVLQQKLALKEGEKKFKELFEKSGDAILILENEKFIDCNIATVAMLKYDSKEQFLDVHPSKLSPEIQADGRNSIEKADEMMNIALKNGTHRFEWDHVKSNGEIFPVEVLLTVISSEPEKRIIHTVWHDITVRKKAEQELKESEEKFKAIVETASDWIWEIDKTGKYTYSSPKVLSILGYSEKEIIGKTPFDFMPAGEKERVSKVFDEIIKQNKPIDKVENTNIHKNGKLVVLETSGMPFFDSNNKLLGYRGIDREITEYKKSEQLLKESEERFKAISNSANDGIVLMDNYGKVTFWNYAAEKIFDYKKEEITGKNLHSLLTSEKYRDAQNSGFEIFKKTGKGNAIGKTLELEALRKNGESFPVELSLSAIKIKEKWNAIGLIKDITNRKKGEQSVKESEIRLRESNKTKDKFFSILAHDLISPFNTMLGFSKLLVANFEKYDLQKQKKFLGIINYDLQNTYKLLENLLLWSRAQRGVVEFNPQKENLYLLTIETLSLLKQSAENKLITLINNVSEDVNITVDKNMLLTIMRNLISNAIKFTPKNGRVEIGCRVSPIKTDGRLSQQEGNNLLPLQSIQIYVKDSGIGILKEKQTQLFEISENISTKGTDGESGTGLGLILCKEFVEKHGGKIWVESDIGKGSEFIFTLPE